MNNRSSSSCGLMFSWHDDGILNWGGTGMSSVLWGMNPILSWMSCSRTYCCSVQSIEEDPWIYMGTSTFEKGGGLIAFIGIMQTIAVIVNNLASWTIIIVMHIIVTMIEGALVVDSCRMMMSKTMIASIGECRFGQTQCGAAKSMRDFMHCGAVMTVGIHFEYTIWASIIMPIALIHSEYVFAYITEVLRAAIGLSRQQTRRARSHGNKWILSI